MNQESVCKGYCPLDVICIVQSNSSIQLLVFYIYCKVQNVQKTTNSRLSSKTNVSFVSYLFLYFSMYFDILLSICQNVLSTVSHFYISTRLFKICILISTFPNWFSTVIPSIHQYNFHIFLHLLPTVRLPIIRTVYFQLLPFLFFILNFYISIKNKSTNPCPNRNPDAK